MSDADAAPPRRAARRRLRPALALLAAGLALLAGGAALHAYALFGEADTTVAELVAFHDPDAVRAARGDALHLHGVATAKDAASFVLDDGTGSAPFGTPPADDGAVTVGGHVRLTLRWDDVHKAYAPASVARGITPASFLVGEGSGGLVVAVGVVLATRAPRGPEPAFTLAR
ncbi:MAG: hypothetical protein ACYDCK_10415 [Thermoplasmatota archaeon]